MAFPPSFLDEIRARAPLVPVVSRKVKLTKAGREWKGCCPFHNEKTPSFYVNEDKGFYHCFGCQAHGDVIRFVVEQEGLRFPDAVRQLAAEAGLQVPEETPEARERQERQAGLTDVMARAAGWFADQMNGLAGANARRYIEQRGLSAETVKAFGLGYAPDGNKLKSALKDVGEGKLTEVGLIGHAEERGDSYDRFRNRLMFPIRDPRGRVVGFGGRVLGEGQPKYLNSPETVLFDKGRLLYNLDRAGPLARKSGRLFVVEGYMDVIGLAEAGIAEAVAPNGTALTETQIQLLWRVVPEPILCFDGDSAGQNAALRAARRALPLLQPGVSLNILRLPPGQDPDDLVRAQGRDAFLALAAAAEPLHAFLWAATVGAGDTTTPERRAAVKEALLAQAAEIANPDIRAQYDRLFRDRFWEAFGWKGKGAAGLAAPERSQPMRRPTPIRHEVQAVIVGLLNHPDIAADHADAIAALPLPTTALMRLRNAILDAVAWNPHLDSEVLRHTLAADGLLQAADEARDGNRLDYSFTRPGSAPERARTMLVVKIEALAALHENYGERLRQRRELRDVFGGDVETGEARERGVEIMAQLRALDGERRALYDRLAEQAAEAGPDPAMRGRPLKDRRDDGEGEHGGDGQHGLEGGRQRATA